MNEDRERPARVSVIIPAFDEVETIAAVVQGAHDALGDEAEIIVVDDGSDDGTGEAARRAGARVLRHPYSIGNGAAVKAGIRAASAPLLVIMDGDGQHDPSDAPRLLDRLSEYDLVVGARTLGPGSAALGRRLANRVYSALASYIAGRRVADLTSGFRAVRAPVARQFLYLLPNGFSSPSTITLACLQAGFRVAFEAIDVRERRGKSKIRPLPDGLKFFIIIFRTATFYSPLKIFLPVSAAAALLGLVNYLYTFLTQHRFTNMSMLLLLSSVLFFLLGLVADQIAKIRFQPGEETHRRDRPSRNRGTTDPGSPGPGSRGR